jgi:hypothetical protein
MIAIRHSSGCDTLISISCFMNPGFLSSLSRPSAWSPAGDRVGEPATHLVAQEGLHLAGAVHGQRPLGNSAALGDRNTSAHLLDFRDRAGRHAHLAQAESQKELRVHHAAAHLSANVGRHTGLPRHVQRSPQLSQHRGIARVVEIRHLLVAPIDRQRVLDQVVGADRHEVDLPDERIEHDHRRRRLDHHPHRHLRIERDAVLRQILHHVGEHHPRLPEFDDRGNERKKDADIPQGARPEDGPQLRAKHRQLP